jgi:hypothetical protein
MRQQLIHRLARFAEVRFGQSPLLFRNGFLLQRFLPLTAGFHCLSVGASPLLFDFLLECLDLFLKRFYLLGELFLPFRWFLPAYRGVHPEDQAGDCQHCGQR